VLIPTGWLLTTGLVAGDELYELLRHRLHEPAGHVLAVALAVRLVYLHRRGQRERLAVRWF